MSGVVLLIPQSQSDTGVQRRPRFGVYYMSICSTPPSPLVFVLIHPPWCILLLIPPSVSIRAWQTGFLLVTLKYHTFIYQKILLIMFTSSFCTLKIKPAIQVVRYWQETGELGGNVILSYKQTIVFCLFVLCIYLLYFYLQFKQKLHLKAGEWMSDLLRHVNEYWHHKTAAVINQSIISNLHSKSYIKTLFVCATVTPQSWFSLPCCSKHNIFIYLHIQMTW